MSPLWVLPVAVLAVGVALLAVTARRLASDLGTVRAQAATLREISEEASRLAPELDGVRRRGEALAGTPDRFRAARAAAREVRRGGGGR